MLQYTQDFDEQMVRDSYGDENGDTKATAADYKWMDAIYTYVKSEQIFTCPSGAASSAPNEPFRYWRNLPAGAHGAYYGSYAYNFNFSSRGCGSSDNSRHQCRYLREQ